MRRRSLSPVTQSIRRFSNGIIAVAGVGVGLDGVGTTVAQIMAGGIIGAGITDAVVVVVAVTETTEELSVI
jgi:hypothetical protein